MFHVLVYVQRACRSDDGKAELCSDGVRHKKLIGAIKVPGLLKRFIHGEFIFEDDVSKEEVIEEAHDREAVHAIHGSTVARKSVREVLDAQSSLTARGEEANERCED